MLAISAGVERETQLGRIAIYVVVQVVAGVVGVVVCIVGSGPARQPWKAVKAVEAVLATGWSRGGMCSWDKQ